MMQRFINIAFVALLVGSWSKPTIARADVPYAIDDGSAERTLGIDPGEDMIWFNTFPVQPGGEVINSISVAYGRPGLTQALNGLPITILLYEDANGGSPWDAVLKTSVNAFTANAHTNTLNVYSIAPTEVHGTLLAAALFRNTTSENKFIGSIDQTAPSFSDRSFVAFAVNLDASNLSSIPAGQFGTLESLGTVGNVMIRANGVPIPEPTLLAPAIVVAAISLRWRNRVVDVTGQRRAV